MLVDPAFRTYGNEKVRVSLWRIPQDEVELFNEHLEKFFVKSLKCDEEIYGDVIILEGRASLIKEKLLLILSLRSKKYDYNTFSVVEKLPPESPTNQEIESDSSSSSNDEQ